MTAPDSTEAPAPEGDARSRDTALDASGLEASGLESAAAAVDTLEPVAEPEPVTEPELTPAAPAPGSGPDPDSTPDPDAAWATSEAPATALTWIDTAVVADHSLLVDDDQDEAPTPALWAGARLRSGFSRPRVLVPLGVLTALAATYAATTLMWPLTEVAPTVQAAQVSVTPAAAATIAWPTQGSAAVGVGGMSTAASTTDAAAIASITKVVSALMVLDRMPLAVGEQGPSFSFTAADSQAYMTYLWSDQSALDVPVDGSLTEYQMLQGVLLGSANNYIDRLAREIWGSDQAFADAAATWLRDRGLEGITLKTPSGFDDRNTATPAALIAVAETAMKNPVFAEIVSTASVDLPGAGTVKNTNGMLADAGVVGIKTGTLYESWNLLTAKDVTVGDTTVRLYASVLTQADNDMRLESTRSLFAQVEAALQEQGPAVPEGTVVGTVETLWGASSDIVTDADADVVLWNSAVAQATTDIELGAHRKAGADVGTLTTVGPLDTATTPLSLASTIEDPSPWWRLTHPLELLGLTAEQH